MPSPRDAEYDIKANDKSDTGTKSAERNLSRLQRKLDDVDKSTKRTADATAGLEGKLRAAGGGLTRTAVAVGRLGATVGALGAALVPVATGVAHFVAGLASVASAVGPAAASLAPLAVGVGLIVATLKASGPALAESVSSIGTAFGKAGEAAGVVAAKGVSKLSREFVRLNMPGLRSNMLYIADAVNGIVLSVGKWVNSVTGQRAIATATTNVAEAFHELAPDVSNLALAFLNLFGRTAGDTRALDLLATGLNRVIVGITNFINGLTTEKINAAWAAVAVLTDKVQAFSHMLLDVGRWLSRTGVSVKGMSDAIAVASVVIGAMTGGVLPVIVGLLTLLANHWDQVKSAVSNTVAQFRTATAEGGSLSGIMTVMRSAVSDLFSWLSGKLMPALQRAGSALMPTLRQAVELVTRTLRDNKDGVQKVQAILTVLGIVITSAVIPALTLVAQILIGTVAAAFSVVVAVINRVVLPAIRIMARIFLDQLGAIVHAAAASFGWIPGIGPKLKEAAAQFDRFRNQVNGALSGIKDKSVNVTVHYNSTGTPIASGPGAINPPGKHIAFSDGAGFQFAEAGGGGARTGGPASISVAAPNVSTDVVVLLDGTPIRAIVREEIKASSADNARRATYGRR